MAKKKETKTSAFGSPGRRSRDSSASYSSRVYQDQLSRSVQPVEEAELPESARDRIFLHAAESMAELLDNCIHLMITSPPHNVLEEYDEGLSLTEYLAFLRTVFKETCRVLSAGGRACNNIANLGRILYLPMHAFIIEEMLNIGFLMRGEVLWDKGAGAASSTAWGTWLSAKNPVLRDVREYILIFSKQAYGRQSQENHPTLEKAEFPAWTKSIWTFPTASARSIGHPAPFLKNSHAALIHLHAFSGDVILDPFCGSGTTCAAAKRAGRRYGYEIEPILHQIGKGSPGRSRTREFKIPVSRGGRVGSECLNDLSIPL